MPTEAKQEVKLTDVSRWVIIRDRRIRVQEGTWPVKEISFKFQPIVAMRDCGPIIARAFSRACRNPDLM